MFKEFIPYEQALALKELGFDEECLGTYYEEDKTFYLNGVLYSNSYFTKAQELISEHPQITTPLYQQAFRWFREKYNTLATIYSNASGYLYEWHDAIGGTHRGWSEYEGPNDGGVWDTYEEAELACLRKLIEIVKQR